MSFTALTSNEVDAKSPVDDTLAGKIKDDLDDLNSRVILAGAAPFVFELQGKFDYWSKRQRSICASIVNDDFTPSKARYTLKKSGSVALSFDLRKHTSPKTPILAINAVALGLTQSVARVTGLATQSISRAALQITTQSISFAHAANNVQSIIALVGSDLGADMWLYNLASPLSADSLVTDQVIIASCTAGANNGTFAIVEANRGGGNNVVVHNPSGVAQSGLAGTVQEDIMSYNYTNPVDSHFTVGASVLMAGHSNAANDGTFVVWALNSGGNNIRLKNQNGVVQGGSGGNANTCLFKYVFSSAANTSDFVVGQVVYAHGHSSGSSDGNWGIFAVNDGGNNVVVNVPDGVTQVGVAGNVDTWQWTFAVAGSPANATAGDGLYLTTHADPGNNGFFAAQQINRSAGNNFVIYNTAGVAQGGVAGQVVTTKKIVKFASDQSANYTTNSYIEIQGAADPLYNPYWSYAPFRVTQVNRGGGANYNVVIETAGATVAAGEQASPAGYVQVEMKSIFNNHPTLATDWTGVEPNRNIVGVSTDMVNAVVPAGTPIGLYILGNGPTGADSLTIVLR